MFFTNVDNLIPGLQNLWRAVRRFLLSEETLPRLLISKAVTVVVMCVMSVTKCAYLFDLSVFLWVMFTSRGTVSSKMWNLLFTLYSYSNFLERTLGMPVLLSDFCTVISDSTGYFDMNPAVLEKVDKISFKD